MAHKKWAVRENFSDIIHFYISTTSLDVFLKCLSNRLKNGFLDHLTVSSEFSLMADETTNIADWAELAIFVHYVDSDRHSITEKFVSLLDIEKICEIFKEKEVDVKVDVEVEVDVQTLPPPFPAERGGARSVVFVYLIPKQMPEWSWCIHHDCLETYEVFKCEGSRRSKKLEVTEKWLFHRDASTCLISRMESHISASDTIINNKSEPEIKGIQD